MECGGLAAAFDTITAATIAAKWQGLHHKSGSKSPALQERKGGGDYSPPRNVY
jgi:hypothetical protein